jgi:ATP-binding cassette subfamily E protein 1
MVTSDNYVIVSEHDILILDYLSDTICILYGDSGAYGVASKPYPVGDGINIFLSGLIPTENYRFRDDDLSF